MLGSCDYKKGSHDNHKRGYCDQNQRSCLVRILCVIDAGKEHGNKASYVSFTWSYCSANLEAVAGEVWNMWEGRKRRSLPAD